MKQTDLTMLVTGLGLTYTTPTLRPLGRIQDFVLLTPGGDVDDDDQGGPFGST